MKRKKLMAVLLSMSMAASSAAGVLAFPVFAEETEAKTEEAAEAEAVIFPVNNATVLAGSTFDLKVELNNLTSEASEFHVTVNGQDADEFFGKEASEGETTLSGQYKMWEGVSLKEAGEVTVAVSASGDDWELNKEVVYEVRKASEAVAKNVILVVGDGMAAQMRNAARMVSRGLTKGKYNSLLEMDDMDQLCMVTTSGLNSLVTDSANSASAYATGHKTSNNAMGVYTFDPNDTEQAAPKVENIVELAKTAGKATGLVTTAEITDATPAAMFSHVPSRYSYQEIVDQMLNNESQRPDVIMGGGVRWFWPQSTTGSKRTDETDAIAGFENLGYTFVGDGAELDAVDTDNTNQILGLFHSTTMNVYVDREIEKNEETLGSYPDQPTLYDMTQTALDVLSKDEDGFFLMVEGASIDKQEHNMDWERAVWDTIEMDKAVGLAKDYADEHGDTLVIVVADHSHSVSVYGTVDYSKTGNDAVRVYEDAGWPTYQDTDGDGFPDTGEDADGDGVADQVVATDIGLAIGWGNHPDYVEDYKYSSIPISPAVAAEDGDVVANFEGASNGGVFFPGNLPKGQTQEVHSADDVPLTAYGAGSDYFDKTVIDNTEVFWGMVNALGLDPSAAQE
ncbi:MAG: alkaline phosphatase [Lachnospiraceae bacterium]|nr:alkaline phosphatase [Lachnospiraceae bacterium]